MNKFDYNDILLHKKLQKIVQMLILDESIHNPNDAKLSIEHGACKPLINIKPGRVGGYSNAIKIAEDLGKDKVWCGGMLEI